MYEKTIGGDHRIYKITVTSTPTLVYDLLSTEDKADYDALLTQGEAVQPLSQFASFNDDRKRARTPIDGYCYSDASDLYFTTSDTSNAYDHVYPDERYSCPIYFWPHKTYVSSPAGATAIVRIFFS